MIPGLKGRRVLFVGSSTGIGAEAAKALAAHGARVVVHANASVAEGEKVVAAIKAAGGEAWLVTGDVTRTANCKTIVEQAAALMGGIDILINNAGALLKRVPIGDFEDEAYDRILDLNIRAVLATTRYALDYLKQDRGVIINTSSVAARNGAGPGASMYGGAKAFVSNLTRSMAKEFAPFGIRANAVAPGTILTPFHERYSTAEMLENTRKNVPMGRLGQADECNGAYLFLASNDLSGYVTGQVIEVNGGLLMP